MMVTQLLSACSLAASLLLLSLSHAAGPDAMEGLPGQIIQKFRDHKNEESIDLLEELQGTYEWVNEQPEWGEFSFPLDQIIPVPMVGDVRLHIDGLRFTQFEAVRDAQSGAAVVERTSYGYRLGLFNIGVELSGIELTTTGFFASSHTGTLNIDLQDCYLDIEMVRGQAVPRVTGKIQYSSYSFQSPSIMTQLLLGPVLMLSESVMNETIEEAFAWYMTQFWLPIDMEFYVAVAADAFTESESSTVGLPKEQQVNGDGLVQLDDGLDDIEEYVELEADLHLEMQDIDEVEEANFFYDVQEVKEQQKACVVGCKKQCCCEEDEQESFRFFRPE